MPRTILLLVGEVNRNMITALSNGRCPRRIDTDRMFDRRAVYQRTAAGHARTTWTASRVGGSPVVFPETHDELRTRRYDC